VGKITCKVSSFKTLSDPKSNTETDLLPWVVLYISAPRTVNVELGHDTVANEMYAVVVPLVFVP
jgi:hypothetical protein